jgi:hypothetical protein
VNPSLAFYLHQEASFFPDRNPFKRKDWPLLGLYPLPDLNRHPFEGGDFKSPASTLPPSERSPSEREGFLHPRTGPPRSFWLLSILKKQGVVKSCPNSDLCPLPVHALPRSPSFWMAVSVPFISRFLVLSLRRFGLARTDDDTALILHHGQWSLPRGAEGQYTAAELHQLCANVAAEQAGPGPDLLWLLVADAESSGVFSALEVAETLTLFNRGLLSSSP